MTPPASHSASRTRQQVLLEALDPVPIASSKPIALTEPARAGASAEQMLRDQALLRSLARAHPRPDTPAAPTAPAAPGRRAGRRAGWALAASAVAAVALAGTLTAVRGGHQAASADPTLPTPLVITTHGTHADAVALLTSMAALQAAQPAPRPVMYAKTRNYALSTTVSGHRSTTDVMTTVREVWVSAHGPAQVKEYDQATTPAGGDVGGPRDTGSGDHTGYYKGHSWGDDNVPRQPTVATAYASLTAEAAQQYAQGDPEDTDAQTPNFTIGDLVDGHLSLGTATPVQAAANYRLLATAPGVFDAGQVTDDAGRRGVAVGIQVSDEPPGYPVFIEYFVIDPSTGAPLETQVVGNFPPPALRLPHRPTVDQYAVLLRTGSVDELGQALRTTTP